MKHVLGALALLVLLASSAWATTPTVSGECNTTTSVGSSHVVDLTGCGTFVAGDLALVCGSLDSGVTSVTWGGGFNEMFDSDFTGGTATCAYLVATGALTSVTVTSTPSNDDAHWNAYRIGAGTYTSPPQATAPTLETTDDNGTTADPPASPTVASDTNLFISIYFSSRSETTENHCTSGPTNYTNLLQFGTTASDTVPYICSARRAVTAASDDPGVFTIATDTDNFAVTTIVIKPVSGAAARAMHHYRMLR